MTRRLVRIDPDESSHTDAPWAVTAEDYNGSWTVTSQNYGPIAMVAHVSGNTTAINYANAHLIAAAPDLLASLKAALATHGEPCNNAECRFLVEARAAIAKAGGREDHPAWSQR